MSIRNFLLCKITRDACDLLLLSRQLLYLLDDFVDGFLSFAVDGKTYGSSYDSTNETSDKNKFCKKSCCCGGFVNKPRQPYT